MYCVTRWIAKRGNSHSFSIAAPRSAKLPSSYSIKSNPDRASHMYSGSNTYIDATATAASTSACYFCYHARATEALDSVCAFSSVHAEARRSNRYTVAAVTSSMSRTHPAVATTVA